MYLSGLENPLIKHRYAVTTYNGAYQTIVGTDEDGIILYAPGDKWMEWIGTDVMKLEADIEEVKRFNG